MDAPPAPAPNPSGELRSPEPLRLLRWRSRTQAFVERLDGLELTMLRIPPGSFLMGSPEAELERQANEGPLHAVSLGEFLMARTPITQAQWRAVAGWQRREEKSWGRDPKPERRKLFISHSHQDRKWADRLRTVLRPLERSDGPGVDLWDPSRIEAGTPWMEELHQVLASAKAVLLLVSPEFLASEFVTRSELPALFNAAREEGLRILWVPLRPCLWKEIPEIMQYQAVIPPGRALAEMSEVEQEEALVEIARTLEMVLREDPQLLVPEMNTERDLNPDPSCFQGETARLLEGETATDQRPVERVSWHDAMEFCRRLSQRTGRHYTLPSEAQWEYACRAGTTTPFHFGETITPELANYDGNSTYGAGPEGEVRRQTTPVGSFPANAWGLHDMHGNVFEWCLDPWHGSYAGAPSDGSAWLDPEAGEGAMRLLRGGSWNSYPGNCRSAYRFRFQPVDVSNYVGFRVVCLPQGPSTAPRKPGG